MSRSALLVAIDFSQSSHAAFAWAASYARGRDVTLHLVHVVEGPLGRPAAQERAAADAQILFDQAQGELAKLVPAGDGQPTCTSHVRHGHPVRTILTMARELDVELLVVGSHGHTGLERILVGSVAERLVRLADCPVVVVKAPPAT